jgi:dynein heavy chain 2
VQSITTKRGIDWEAIHGIMEDAIYGGRVDNAYDLRVLRTYLSIFFSDRVASDKAAGQEIISGTPLRMPSSPEFEAFRKIISSVYKLICARLLSFVYLVNVISAT